MGVAKNRGSNVDPNMVTNSKDLLRRTPKHDPQVTETAPLPLYQAQPAIIRPLSKSPKQSAEASAAAINTSSFTPCRFVLLRHLLVWGTRARVLSRQKRAQDLMQGPALQPDMVQLTQQRGM